MTSSSEPPVFTLADARSVCAVLGPSVGIDPSLYALLVWGALRQVWGPDPALRLYLEDYLRRDVEWTLFMLAMRGLFDHRTGPLLRAPQVPEAAAEAFLRPALGQLSFPDPDSFRYDRVAWPRRLVMMTYLGLTKDFVSWLKGPRASELYPALFRDSVNLDLGGPAPMRPPEEDLLQLRADLGERDWVHWMAWMDSATRYTMRAWDMLQGEGPDSVRWEERW